MKLRTVIAAVLIVIAAIVTVGCSEDNGSADYSSNTVESSAEGSYSQDDSSIAQTSNDSSESLSDEPDSRASEETTTTTAEMTKQAKTTTKETNSKASETSQTTTAVTTAKSAVKTTSATTAKKSSEQALVWNYNGQCKVTFPASWKGRYVVEGNAVFCKKAHSKETVMGELFRIVSAAKPADSAEYSYVLGSDKKNNYYFAAINTGLVVDSTDKAAVSEMKSMYSQIESVIKNIRCAGTPTSEPVKYYGYGNFNPRTGMAREGFEPSLNQTLTEINSKNKGLKVTGRFNSKDHSFTYTDSKGKSYKGWYIKKIDENNQSKATPFGLVFLNGCVYQYICPPAITAVDVSVLISNASVNASGWYK